MHEFGACTQIKMAVVSSGVQRVMPYGVAHLRSIAPVAAAQSVLVAGGCYGNPLAISEVFAMAHREAVASGGPPPLCVFNGDFNVRLLSVVPALYTLRANTPFVHTKFPAPKLCAHFSVLISKLDPIHSHAVTGAVLQRPH